MSAADDAWRLCQRYTEIETTLTIMNHARHHGFGTGGKLGECVLTGAIAALVEIIGEEATFNIVTRAADGIGARLIVSVPLTGKE